MAFPAAEAPPAEPAQARLKAALAQRWAALLRNVEGYPLERIGFAAIAAGAMLRLLAPFLMDFRSDGDTYVAMGHAWMLRHEFLMPYGDVTTWGPTPPGYSNHYPPAYPFYLGVVFSVFGYGLAQAKAAAVVMSLLALAAVYLTTRDLYGRIPAALATGLLGVEPHLVWVTGSGFSENMVLLFFVLTMWAILRSLKDDRYIVLAGLFAGFAYLSRASVGYFFVIAGAGGFLWRFYYRRWKLFTNVWYMLAILLFGGVAAAWATRNILTFPGYEEMRFTLFGQGWLLKIPHWETSSYTRYVQNLAFSQPGEWWYALVMKLPFFAIFLAWYCLPFLPESWRATKRIRQEDTSALWLSVFLVWVTAWAISGMFWVFEHSSLYWFDNHRYILIGLVPLAWLLLREADWKRASARMRYALLLLSLFAACGAVILSPVRFSDLRAAEAMDPYLQAGDEVGIDGGTIKYAFYAYLTHPEQINVYGMGTEGYHPDFILSLKTKYDFDKKDWVCESYGDDYALSGTYKQTYWNRGVMTACLWVDKDVQAARDVPLARFDPGV